MFPVETVSTAKSQFNALKFCCNFLVFFFLLFPTLTYKGTLSLFILFNYKMITRFSCRENIHELMTKVNSTKINIYLWNFVKWMFTFSIIPLFALIMKTFTCSICAIQSSMCFTMQKCSSNYVFLKDGNNGYPTFNHLCDSIIDFFSFRQTVRKEICIEY